jgi:hypothetical protein
LDALGVLALFVKFELEWSYPVDGISHSLCVSPVDQMEGIKLNTGAVMPALSLGLAMREDRSVGAIGSALEVSVHRGLLL